MTLIYEDPKPEFVGEGPWVFYPAKTTRHVPVVRAASDGSNGPGGFRCRNNAIGRWLCNVLNALPSTDTAVLQRWKREREEAAE